MKFSKYYNREAGNRNIYSRRNLLNMSIEELLKRELELAYQYNTIGIPDDDELMSSQNVYQYDDNGVQRWSSGMKTTDEIIKEERLRHQNSLLRQQNNREMLASRNNSINNSALDGFGQESGGNVEQRNADILSDILPEEDLENNLTEQNSDYPLNGKEENPSIREEDDSTLDEILPGLDLFEGIQSKLQTESGDDNKDEPINFDNDPMRQELAENFTPERIEEREAREARELEAFNKAWDKANGVEEKDADGVPTGGAADISENKNLSNIITRCYNDYKNYNDPASAIGYTLGSFLTNFLEMKDADTHGADKYFHARANYDSAQQGPISELVAKIISDVRELSDADRNIREKKYTPEFSQRDIEEDQRANEEGRILGRMFPDIPAYEKLKHRMPKGFPLRYRYK